jgi:hypothetical protein
MAEWAATSNVPRDLFDTVVQLDRVTPRDDANYHQCLAIANWAIGDLAAAERRVQQAETLARSQPADRGTLIFSAWSYLRVERAVFIDDLAELKELIQGSTIRPRFMKARQ